MKQKWRGKCKNIVCIKYEGGTLNKECPKTLISDMKLTKKKKAEKNAENIASIKYEDVTLNIECPKTL